MEPFKITIPELTDTTVKVFVNDEYIGDATTEQASKIRVNVVDYIFRTKDESVLNTFYFIGHEDGEVMGKEIKITMDKDGNLSDLPWEMAHTRRDLLHIIKTTRCTK